MFGSRLNLVQEVRLLLQSFYVFSQIYSLLLRIYHNDFRSHCIALITLSAVETAVHCENNTRPKVASEGEAQLSHMNLI
jgi:hypothetical protein